MYTWHIGVWERSSREYVGFYGLDGRLNCDPECPYRLWWAAALVLTDHSFISLPFDLVRKLYCLKYQIASYSSTSCSKNKIISLSSVPSPRTFVVQNIPPLFPRTFVAIVLPSFFFTRHISFRWNDVLTKTLLYWYFIDAVENCSYRQVICNKNITISISCNKSYALVD